MGRRLEKWHQPVENYHKDWLSAQETQLDRREGVQIVITNLLRLITSYRPDNSLRRNMEVMNNLPYLFGWCCPSCVREVPKICSTLIAFFCCHNLPTWPASSHPPLFETSLNNYLYSKLLICSFRNNTESFVRNCSTSPRKLITPGQDGGKQNCKNTEHDTLHQPRPGSSSVLQICEIGGRTVWLLDRRPDRGVSRVSGILVVIMSKTLLMKGLVRSSATQLVCCGLYEMISYQVFPGSIAEPGITRCPTYPTYPLTLTRYPA